MYQAPVTIEQTLRQIQGNKIVLPAIQREFVWQPEQICELFDSLMQGYPFGTFLYWKVEKENNSNYQFYGFVREYHEKENPHCPRIGEIQNENVIAVLDGQQRLTALNIGLCGSMAKKLPRKRWNNPSAFPLKNLYLDLMWTPDEEADVGVQYKFEFLAPDDKRITVDVSEATECWFAVKDILTLQEIGTDTMEWLAKKLPGRPLEQMTQPNRVLNNLFNVIRQERLVCFYEESSQELERVLQIFIRTNSGGTVLSYSDLLLSVAVAQWSHNDARQEIHQAVDEFNSIGNGFDFSKDWVLKAGLMLSETRSVGFKVENFNRDNMTALETQWSSIKRTLELTVNLVSDFGFSGQTLRAKSALLPIAYYLHVKNVPSNFLTHSAYTEDREAIRRWLVSSLLKPGIWGSGLDTLLTALRQTIKECCGDGFPATNVGKAMSKRGKSLAFDEEEIDSLTDLRYGDRLTFSLLSLIFTHLDLRNHFHIDHVFPKSLFHMKHLKSLDFSDDDSNKLREMMNSLPNLQLLSGAENQEKQKTPPAAWLANRFESEEQKREYVLLHLLDDMPDDLTGFTEFHSARRKRLKDRIRKMLEPDRDSKQ